MKIEDISKYLKIPLVVATGLARAGFFGFANFFFRANTFYFPAQDTIQYLFPSKIKLDKKLAYNDYR